MVHGAGGTLLQHLKEHELHSDLTWDDRVFYFTTCGWMMWHWLVSCLAVGSTVVLYDGAPLLRRRPILWDLAAEERVTTFGTSAKYLALSEKEQLRPRETHDLSNLKAILSTGSPLSPQGFDYVYNHVKSDVRLSSISGGTDLISCFALGNPVGPVYSGEIHTADRRGGRGVRDAGRRVGGRTGRARLHKAISVDAGQILEQCQRPKYRAAYFETFPMSGDMATARAHRARLDDHLRPSDATLNPGGVRIGTAEIYRQVEQFAEVLESVVVGQALGARRQ